MNQSIKIAGIVGPTLLVMSLSEYLHIDSWGQNIPAISYLNGTLLFLGESLSSGAIEYGKAGHCSLP